jgi:glycine cleavage system aminomethyltransferase T
VSSFARDTWTLRQSVVRHAPNPGRVLVRGEHAYEAVDALSSRDLFVRTGQLLHALVLDERGGVEADLLVAPRDEDFLLVADGLDDAGLIERLRAHAPAGASVEFEPLSATHALVGLAGPYAWELLAELLGPELATMPYMSCLSVPELSHAGLCLRAGTTGEFGYDLLLPNADAEHVRARIDELGVRFDLHVVEQTVLDRAALENGFFCPRHRGVLGRSPAELQLQWRVTYDREFRGAAAMRERKHSSQRLAWVIGRLDEQPAQPGPLHRAGIHVGELLEGHASPVLGCFVGLAMIDRALAYPWIDGLLDEQGRELRIEAPPLLQNRSMFVNPRKHVYAHRESDSFPPIVPGSLHAQETGLTGEDQPTP